MYHDIYLKVLLFGGAICFLAALIIRQSLKDNPKYAHLFQKRDLK